jgi:hypothetical protein
MKTVILVVLFSLFAKAFSQTQNWDKEKLASYFTLNCVQAAMRIENKDSVAVFIFPGVHKKGEDVIANAIKNYENRFVYLLMNRTQWESIYVNLYPDTFKIRDLYFTSLVANKPFIDYLNKTIAPFVQKKEVTKTSFSQQELLMVASRFFYCDTVMPDTTIPLHVCVGLNGMKEAQWKKDYTHLEAFCFEAIFTYLRDTKKSGFMKNFVAITKSLKKSYIATYKTTKGLLNYVRSTSFKKMETDRILQQRLLEYYTATKSNLSFTIK